MSDLDDPLEKLNKGIDFEIFRDVLEEKHQGINKVHQKGYKNKPLTEKQKQSNTEKSRVRVEQVFGFMENSIGSLYYRKIGIKSAETVIGLMNLTYNMFRKIQFTTV